MTDPGAGRERAIFEAALQKSGEERKALNRAACGGDEVLAERVRRLLAAHHHAEHFSTGGMVSPPAGPIINYDLSDPETIGPYCSGPPKVNGDVEPRSSNRSSIVSCCKT